MPTYTLFSDDTEILGAVLNDFSNAADSEGFYHIFAKYGLTEDIDPDKWYPGDIWIQALNEISGKPGSMGHLVGIGINQMENVQFPQGWEDMSLKQALHRLDEMNHLSLRGTDIGTITTEEVSPNHMKVILRVFEPDDLWYGIIYAMVRRFRPDNTVFHVSYDSDLPRRDDGSDTTIIHVKWKT